MTLYHYCSNEAFTSIVTRRRIWLSSLRLANDTLEGQLVTSTMMRLASAANLPPIGVRQIERGLHVFDQILDGLGFCLSEDGDLLSQWRGYADDGHGVSIGFNRQYLDDLVEASGIPELGGEVPTSGFSLEQIVYAPHTQEQLLRSTFDALKGLVEEGAFEEIGPRGLLDTRTPEQIAADDARIRASHQALRLKLVNLLPHVFQLKSYAFREEREWRLVSLWFRNTDPCLFRSSRNRVLPYREVELRPVRDNVIDEVVLGPRNITPPEVVTSLLQQAGLGLGAKVRKSEASYR